MAFDSHTIVEGTFDALYGLEVTSAQDGEVRGRVPVREDLKQPAGLVHGGVFASIAEALASLATYVAVAPEGKVAMGLANATSFVRPMTGGEIRAVARVRHRGRTTWIWDVECADDRDRVCALTRMTIAVRDAPGG